MRPRIKLSRQSKRNLAPKNSLNYYSPKPSAGAVPKRRTDLKGTFRLLLKRTVVTIIALAVIAVGIRGLTLTASPQVIASSHTYRYIDNYRQAIINQTKSLKNRNKISFDE